MTHLKRPSNDIVKDLMRKVNQKVPDAENQLLNLLSPWLLDLIRKILDPRVRPVEGSWDILQESLMVVAQSIGQKLDLAPEKFLHYLERVINRKTIDVNRRHLDVQKRQDGRNVHFSAEFSEEHQPFSSDSDPIQEAQARETWEVLIEKSQEPLQTVLRMKFQGFSNQEIAR